MFESFATPQTADGLARRVERLNDGGLRAEVVFELTDRFLSLLDGRTEHLVFASRSRLARLGIDVVPNRQGIVIEGNRAHIEAEIRPTLAKYGIDSILPEVILPGLPLGRLVFCPPERRLSTEQIYRGALEHAFQLPEAFSIDSDGLFTIRPHRRVYELTRPLTKDDVLTILAKADGKSLLNRVQVARPVDRIVLSPDNGLVTSCSMFLHRHFVVLDRESQALGTHLQAVVLDPVSTRGTNVFLEFRNTSSTRIVNPSVKAAIYDAVPVSRTPDRTLVFFPAKSPEEKPAPSKEQYERVRAVFDRLEGSSDLLHYHRRVVAVYRSLDDAYAGKDPDMRWEGPKIADDAIIDVAQRREAPRDSGGHPNFGTHLLNDLEPGDEATVFLGYFPNVIEHVELSYAALTKRVRRIVFRRASYEHGPFFSAKDHSRLAEYHSLGLEVFWCNDPRENVAVHVFRGLRGYFMDPSCVTRFENALIFAFYGSSRPLPRDESERLELLLRELKRLFGGDIAILTGGGPGAMQEATDIAHRLGLMVGANYIETIDQGTNKSADFYQAFQDLSRHSRQRWFEVASFQIFCVGGIGTLEEVGLTLTDMKLGVIDLAPLVFFGKNRHGESYWTDLGKQLVQIAEEGRGPAWLKTHVLMTEDADEVFRFYRRILEVG
ncbi:MAG: LOG family protein [Planctomycetota bacterium]